ncbi:MAG: response regulator transcription factor [FCB group bacterium]|nr:response regulator transcription factor [FCB group bacterium]
MKIFIVDDSLLLCDKLSNLIRENLEVEHIDCFHQAAGAIRSIEEARPEVVILDIRLPDGNGIDLLKEIKLRSPAPKIIMFTSYAYPHYRKKCLSAGADYFFNKSSEFEKVIQVLKDKTSDDLLKA